jgi:DNA processing protein
LLSIPKLGPVGLHRLWEQYQSVHSIWRHLDLPQQQKSVIFQQSEQVYQTLNNQKINLLTIDKSTYPDSLRSIKDITPVLFTRGHIELLQRPMVAVIGSRNSNKYGSEVTEQVVKQLVVQGMVIASGMANGIDTIAHQAALDCQGHTLAVLGGGIVAMTKTHPQLMETIQERGLIISHFLPGIEPQKFTFPARNRLLAALTQGVVVTQAGIRSGSLLTAAAAKEYGRPVFAVPGSIFNPGSQGTHWLLEQGANLAVDGAAIVKKLVGQTVAVSQLAYQSQLSAQEQHLFQLLQAGPTSIDQLIRTSGQSAAQVMAGLSLLEMKEVVVGNQEEYRLK